MEIHRQKVDRVAARVREFYERKKSYRIYHGSTNCTRESTKTADNTVNISFLNEILAIDPVKQTMLVELNVAMDQLVAAALPSGLIPPVVMEFPGITAGGGFTGTSGESSSFRHGFFDRTVSRVEMVLGNGEVIECSPSEHADLFYGAAASFGCLAITTLLEIRLIPAKAYVQMSYLPTAEGVSGAIKIMDECIADPTCDYLDGILYDKDHAVVCSGRLTDSPGLQNAIQRFTGPKDPWFYMHVEEKAQSNQKEVIEYIPLVDYLFRYDRGGFWVGKYAFEYFSIPQNRFTRWLLDGISHTRVMYHAVHKSGLFKEYTIQDIAVPYSAASELVDYLDDSFQRYPIWLCPLRQTTKGADGKIIHGLLADQVSSDYVANQPEMMISLGIWGPGPGSGEGFEQFNRELERRVGIMGGQKWLYGRTYYSETEFASNYSVSNLEALRDRYHATHLPTLYDRVKVCPATLNDRKKGFSILEKWPFPAAYGLLHTFLSKEYLLTPGSKSSILSVPNIMLFVLMLSTAAWFGL